MFSYFNFLDNLWQICQVQGESFDWLSLELHMVTLVLCAMILSIRQVAAHTDWFYIIITRQSVPLTI